MDIENLLQRVVLALMLRENTNQYRKNMFDNLGYVVAISERFRIGPMLGWSFYTPDDVEDCYELNVYIIFIMLHIKWWEGDE
jgi:hypothetical protein